MTYNWNKMFPPSLFSKDMEVEEFIVATQYCYKVSKYTMVTLNRKLLENKLLFFTTSVGNHDYPFDFSRLVNAWYIYWVILQRRFR